MDVRTDCGNVLVAEDDPALRTLIGTTLEDAGFAVSAVARGDAALSAVREQDVAAAVLDIDLPGRSGYEVCRELRRLYGASRPVVFVSGARTEAYDRVAGLLLGADDYLVKPFDPAELVARLEGLLRRAQSNGRRQLTDREREVLGLLAEGLDQREIAQRLAIAPKTVATHIERILPKLGVRSRAQAVAAAYRADV